MKNLIFSIFNPVLELDTFEKLNGFERRHFGDYCKLQFTVYDYSAKRSYSKAHPNPAPKDGSIEYPYDSRLASFQWQANVQHRDSSCGQEYYGCHLELERVAVNDPDKWKTAQRLVRLWHQRDIPGGTPADVASWLAVIADHVIADPRICRLWPASDFPPVEWPLWTIDIPDTYHHSIPAVVGSSEYHARGQLLDAYQRMIERNGGEYGTAKALADWLDAGKPVRVTPNPGLYALVAVPELDKACVNLDQRRAELDAAEEVRLLAEAAEESAA